MKIFNFYGKKTDLNFVEKLKKNKISLCHGVFDLIHIGHINHLKKAKEFSDILIVSITADQFVNKGPGRPVFDQINRAKLLISLTVVDYVIINHHYDSIQLINSLKPNFYVKGDDYKELNKDLSNKIFLEKRAVESNNGKIIFTNEPSSSSSKLINTFFFRGGNDQLEFIRKIRKKYDFLFIQNLFNKIKKENININIFGEIIIDQYSYGEIIGKSGKEPVLVLNESYQETYLGGTAAVANNALPFSTNICLYSSIGEYQDYLKFIKTNLNNSVKLKLYIKPNSKTLFKKRYIDLVNDRKLLGVYQIDDEILNKNLEEKVLNDINKISTNSKNSLNLILDYGHGFFTEKIKSRLSKLKSTILNAQLNSSNANYHSIERYKSKIDMLVINESELRNETKNKFEKLETIIRKFAKNKKFSKILITSGSKGCTLYNKKDNKFLYCPAFGQNIKDKVGSGDVMLLYFSVFQRFIDDDQLSLFVSSIAASSSLSMMANKQRIEPNNILKIIEHLLK